MVRKDFKIIISLFIVMMLLSLSLVSSNFLINRGVQDLPEGMNRNNLCIDTDANKDSPEFKRGYVQDLNGIFWDECNADENGPDLIERVCDDGFVKDELYYCEKGCYLGACVKFSFFSLPKKTYLPASQKFLSLQRFTISRFGKENSGSKYSLNLFNIIDLNGILKDIDARLKALEAAKSQEVFPLNLRLTAVSSLDAGEIEILEMAYYHAEYDGSFLLEKVSFMNPDLEIFVGEEDFDILNPMSDESELTEHLAELYSNDLVNFVALSEKGKAAREKGLNLIS